MGPRVLRVVLLIVSAVVTVAIFALAPLYFSPVLAAVGGTIKGPQPHCGGA